MSANAITDKNIQKYFDIAASLVMTRTVATLTTFSSSSGVAAARIE
jgi:hypothetical protein